jgi:hypothetical protein
VTAAILGGDHRHANPEVDITDVLSEIVKQLE